MKLRFTKMQGTGNDFVMLDGVRQEIALTREQLRRLADRRLGVGADQVLVVERSPEAGADFLYRIFNADGGEVEQCGNGARCFVKFVHQLGLSDRAQIRVLTAGGLIVPRLEPDGSVSVDMGQPDFAPQASGFRAEGLPVQTIGAMQFWSLPVAGATPQVGVVSMGNPHAVQFVADVLAAPVGEQGPGIERHPRFAQGVNAGFAQITGRHGLVLRVWERGTGETLACGSGACAAVAVGIRAGWLDSPVTVQAPGGALELAWVPGGSLRLRGPAQKVFDGEIELP